MSLIPQVRVGSDRAATASETTVSARYRADVQGLRGVAVLLVVLYHANGFVGGGYVGVDVFFVISGFVIARSLVSDAERDGRVDLVAFYRRRVRRLLPALAVLLGTVAVAIALLQSPFSGQRYGLRTGLAASLSFSNVYLYSSGGGYFSPLDENNPLLHTWSLGVEEQFYLVFPLIAYAAYRWSGGRALVGRRRVVVLVGIGSAVSFIASCTLVALAKGRGDFSTEAERFAFYLPFTRAWQFGCGIVVALTALEERFRRVSATVIGIAGLVAVTVAAVGFDDLTSYPGIASALPTVGAAAVLVARVGPTSDALRLRPLVWLGDISYSWYLWHWPAIVFVRLEFPDSPELVVLAAILSLLPAVGSYRWVEHRFRVRPSISSTARRRPRTPVLVAACVAVPVLLAGGLSENVLHLNDRIDPRPEFTVGSAVEAAGCLRPLREVAGCPLSNVGDSAGTILLVGDSHAAAISGGVVEAAEARGRDVVFAGMAACPFVLAAGMPANDSCARHRALTIELLRKTEPELVVIANRSTLAALQIELGRFEIPVQTRTASEAAITAWVDAYRQTLEEVASLAGSVVVVSEVPQMSAEVYGSALPTVVRPHGREPTFEESGLDAPRRAVLGVEQEEFDQVEGVEVLDPAATLCADPSCPLRIDETFLYRDHQHLSTAAQPRIAELLRDPFDRLLPAP